MSTCILCKFSSLQAAASAGPSQLQCRRRSPQVLLLPGDRPGSLQITSVFPSVDATCFCGDFESDPNARTARNGDTVQHPGSVA